MSKIRANQSQGKGKPVPPIEALASDLGKGRFLAALAADAFCNTKEACKKAGIKVADLPRLLNEDKAFREAHDEIQAQYTANLEGILHERVTRNDTLLWKLLQQRNPEKYGDGTASSIAVQMTPEQVKAMSLDELRELRSKLSKN